MAGYTYNRNGFAGTQPHELRLVYCSLVAIELALKEFLGKIHTTGNRGHNVPHLLQQFAGVSGDAGTVSSLATQLSGALTALWSQNGNGSSKSVPHDNYPYLRYLRHESDGWGEDQSTDMEVQHLADVVKSTRALLRNEGVM